MFGDGLAGGIWKGFVAGRFRRRGCVHCVHVDMAISVDSDELAIEQSWCAVEHRLPEAGEDQDQGEGSPSQPEPVVDSPVIVFAVYKERHGHQHQR